MDAEFVFSVEHSHGLNCFGDGLAAADKNAIDIKGKDEGVGHGGRREW